MISDTSEKGRNADSTQSRDPKSHLCRCGCGQELPFIINKKTKEKIYRSNAIYASRRCKDRMRNHQRYDRQKQATALAIQILENQGYEIRKRGAK